MTLCYSHKKEDPFVRIDKSIVYDKKLSWKAKGLLLYAFSRPDNWNFFKSEMINHSSDGETSFDSGIKELEKVGYLHRTKLRKEGKGHFDGWQWHFFETPISDDEFKLFLRNGGFTDIGESPTSGKPGTTKNDLRNKNEKTTTSSSLFEEDDDEEEKVGRVVWEMKKIGINGTTVKNSMRFSTEEIETALYNTKFKKDPDDVSAYFYDQLKNGYKKKETAETREKEEMHKIDEMVKENEKRRDYVKRTCDDRFKANDNTFEFRRADSLHVLGYLDNSFALFFPDYS